MQVRHKQHIVLVSAFLLTATTIIFADQPVSEPDSQQVSAKDAAEKYFLAFDQRVAESSLPYAMILSPQRFSRKRGDVEFYETVIAMAKEKGYDHSIAAVLRGAITVESQVLMDEAKKGLDYVNPDDRALPEYMRDAALEYCLHHAEMLDDETRRRLKKMVVQRFRDSDGQDMLASMQALGDAEDRPVLRRIYEDHFREQAFPGPASPGPYSCEFAFHRGGTTRGDMLMLLHQVGDPLPKQEVIATMIQRKDAQQVAWGVFMAKHLGDPDLLEFVVPVLDDDRTFPEILGRWPSHPDVPGHRGRLEISVRLCDLAAMTIADMSDEIPIELKRPRFLFHQRGANWWEQYFEEKERSKKPVWDAKEGVVVSQVLVGYKQEELDEIKASLRRKSVGEGE